AAAGRRSAEPRVVVIMLKILDSLAGRRVDERDPPILEIHRDEFRDETRTLAIPLVLRRVYRLSETRSVGPRDLDAVGNRVGVRRHDREAILRLRITNLRARRTLFGESA